MSQDNSDIWQWQMLMFLPYRGSSSCSSKGSHSPLYGKKGPSHRREVEGRCATLGASDLSCLTAWMCVPPTLLIPLGAVSIWCHLLFVLTQWMSLTSWTNCLAGKCLGVWREGPVHLTAIVPLIVITILGFLQELKTFLFAGQSLIWTFKIFYVKDMGIIFKEFFGVPI